MEDDSVKNANILIYQLSFQEISGSSMGDSDSVYRDAVTKLKILLSATQYSGSQAPKNLIMHTLEVYVVFSY